MTLTFTSALAKLRSIALKIFQYKSFLIPLKWCALVYKIKWKKFKLLSVKEGGTGVYKKLKTALKEGREGGYQIPVPSLNLAQIPVPRLIFAKTPVTKFSVCITALFALKYLISSTILRRNLFRSHFYLPFTISSRHMQTCRTCPLTRKTDRT